MNPNAIHLLEKNPDKIVWYWLSMNPSAIYLLEKNPEKIDWESIYKNPAIFGIDFKEIEMRMNIIKEELIAVALHPDRIAYLFELEEELDYYI